jgi:regulator of protease activity HflC (stomatin/prohibitin superfamily)
MDEDEAKQVRAAIFQAVDQQLADGDPPEAQETLERLMAEGYTRNDAREYIACAMADEMFQIMQREREYDRARYVNLLRRLPTLPWE